MKKILPVLVLFCAVAGPCSAQTADDWLANASSARSLKKKIEFSGRAIALRPDLAAAYRTRGEARLEWGDYAGAEEDFTRCLELGDVLCLTGRARTRMESGALEKAAEDLTQALSSDRLSKAYLYIQRGRVYERLGNPAAAEADFGRASQILPAPDVRILFPPASFIFACLRWMVYGLAFLMFAWGLALLNGKAAVIGAGREPFHLRLFQYAAAAFALLVRNLLFFLFIAGLMSAAALVLHLTEPVYYAASLVLLVSTNVRFFRKRSRRFVRLFNVTREDTAAALKDALGAAGLGFEDLGETFRLRETGTKLRLLFSARLKMGTLAIDDASRTAALPAVLTAFGETLRAKKISGLSPAAVFNLAAACAALLVSCLIRF